jgi:chemotaxis protein methyltransferase CheR
LLGRLLPDWQDWSVTVLATDINSRFLQKAVQGVYSEWSFRDVAPWLKARYFRRIGTGHYEIRPQIKQRVTFSQLNLADATYPLWAGSGRPFDIVFCRNVLMYFADEQARKTVQKLYTTLAEGGWLVVSPSDTMDALLSPLVQDSYAGAVFYQRRDQVHLVETPAPGLTSPMAPVSSTTKRQTPQVGAPPSALLRLDDEGNDTEAEQEALTLSAQHPQTGQLAMQLALVYANQGKLAQARQWCERAIVADRMNPGIYYLQATIQQEQGDLPGAQISLRQALYLDPRYVLAHFALGYCALRQGKIAEANKCFANTRVILKAYGADTSPRPADGLTPGELMAIVRMIDQVR